MALFALADLHLSFSSDKPMDVFGSKWEGYENKIKNNWNKLVNNDDIVLIAGDISWAMKWEEAKIDLKWISELTGSKILLRGNHDYWWTSLKKMQEFDSKMKFLQNNFYIYKDSSTQKKWAICGTRGWICPNEYKFTENDEKIYKREQIRLKMSLDEAKKAGFENILVMTHYPPTNSKFESSAFTDIYEQYGVKQVVYGHLHTQKAFAYGFKGVRNGVEYKLLSGDYVDFVPQKLLD